MVTTADAALCRSCAVEHEQQGEEEEEGTRTTRAWSWVGGLRSASTQIRPGFCPAGRCLRGTRWAPGASVGALARGPSPSTVDRQIVTRAPVTAASKVEQSR